MKTTNSKTLTVILALTLILTISSSFKTSSMESYKYATMTVLRVAYGWDTKISIVYEDGKTEEIPLAKSSEKTYLQNTIKINSALNSLGTKGYELVSSSNEVYTFVKK